MSSDGFPSLCLPPPYVFSQAFLLINLDLFLRGPGTRCDLRKRVVMRGLQTGSRIAQQMRAMYPACQIGRDSPLYMVVVSCQRLH